MAAQAEPMELELEAAAILCDLRRILRARDRRRMRREQELSGEAAPEIPSWGRRRRRLRSVLLEDSKPAAAGAGVAERDGAASPDTTLAFFPDSVADEDDDATKKASAQEEWALQQRGVVASLSQENADLLRQIEEYRARLLSSRSANESLKRLHKVRQQEEQARRMRVLLLPQGTAAPIPLPPSNPGPLAAIGLDLNEPAGNDAEEAAAAAKARATARAAAQERYWQVQKAAVTAEARRRRREILRAKVASPLVSCRTRRVVG